MTNFILNLDLKYFWTSFPVGQTKFYKYFSAIKPAAERSIISSTINVIKFPQPKVSFRNLTHLKNVHENVHYMISIFLVIETTSDHLSRLIVAMTGDRLLIPFRIRV